METGGAVPAADRVVYSGSWLESWLFSGELPSAESELTSAVGELLHAAQ